MQFIENFQKKRQLQKKMEHSFSICSSVKFLGSSEFLKGSRTSCLLGQNVQTKIRVSFFKTHLWYHSGFHDHFSFNGTELRMGDGERLKVL